MESVYRKLLEVPVSAGSITDVKMSFTKEEIKTLASLTMGTGTDIKLIMTLPEDELRLEKEEGNEKKQVEVLGLKIILKPLIHNP